ncbi:flagellar basal body rod C-terminal domain-containing protein [Tissierella carlieri]|uniref:flagellar basal body rod C-terminal domain-containing protein n=1 Tax=Tissierella carlieri TaxID=689904 RepID=UPI00386CDD95
MNRSLYIGATSLVANQKKLDVLSNNLANINTAGFKRDISLTESFPEKLLAKMSRTPELRNIAGENNITYETNGQVHTARTQEGYFVVNTSRGKSYVKEIEFVVDEEGYLKTSYKNLEDEHKTDYENYIINNNGNRVQQAGDMENLLQGLVYNPPSYIIGTMSGGVRFQKLFTDFTNGGLIDTGGTLDVAIKGNGFFKIQGENGETLYTRNGSFAITEGYLTDLDGRRVLGRNGTIFLGNGTIDILSDGEIQIDGNPVDTLDIVDINNKEFLRKRGDNIFYMADNTVAEENIFDGEILQGYLEGSNMNPISGMVEMINLLREFEANQKVIRMQDEMLEKAANEIGRV